MEKIEPLPTVVSEGDGQPRGGGGGGGGGVVEGGGDGHGDGDDLWIKITEEKAQRGDLGMLSQSYTCTKEPAPSLKYSDYYSLAKHEVSMEADLGI